MWNVQKSNRLEKPGNGHSNHSLLMSPQPSTDEQAFSKPLTNKDTTEVPKNILSVFLRGHETLIT